jgi:transposase
MARKRLKLFEYAQIIEELRSGASCRLLDAKGMASRNTLRKIKDVALSRAWLDPTGPMPTNAELKEAFPPPPVPIRASSLEPYRAKIVEWVQMGCTPKQIFRSLKRDEEKQGKELAASVGGVKRFVKHIKPPTPVGFVVLHFEPGEAAQLDFGSGPMLVHPATGKLTRTHFFVMTLCHSRHQYAEIVWDQKVETWLRCHRNAFEFFGGLPGTVTIDNLKSAITRACFNDPIVQRSYEEFARRWGFRIEPCKPRTPRHKGRVESGVKYVKGAFLPLRQFRHLRDANHQLLEWVLGEAGNRVHGTTHEMPLRAFAEREREALRDLPDPRPEVVAWAIAKLHDNCHVTFEKSYYSAPYRLINQQLQLRVGERLVELHHEDECVAVHPRAERPGTFRTNTEHYPPEKVAYLMKTPQWCLRQALNVGPSCHRVVSALLSDGVVKRLAGAQGILGGLQKKYGPKRLETACERALEFENIGYGAIKSILEKGLDIVPESPDSTGQLHFVFPNAPRFARDIGGLLTAAGGGL